MRGITVLSLAAAFLAASAVYADDLRVTTTGWVSDERCGAKHARPGQEESVKKCLKGDPSSDQPDAKPQRMVFVTDGERKIWVVTNPGVLEGYEGQHVRISGRVNPDRKTVRVTQVMPIGRPKKKAE